MPGSPTVGGAPAGLQAATLGRTQGPLFFRRKEPIGTRRSCVLESPGCRFIRRLSSVRCRARSASLGLSSSLLHFLPALGGPGQHVPMHTGEGK